MDERFEVRPLAPRRTPLLEDLRLEQALDLLQRTEALKSLTSSDAEPHGKAGTRHLPDQVNELTKIASRLRRLDQGAVSEVWPTL